MSERVSVGSRRMKRAVTVGLHPPAAQGCDGVNVVLLVLDAHNPTGAAPIGRGGSAPVRGGGRATRVRVQQKPSTLMKRMYKLRTLKQMKSVVRRWSLLTGRRGSEVGLLSVLLQLPIHDDILTHQLMAPVLKKPQASTLNDVE
ncbi:hypothetical protein H4582DRAFT_2061855 [Lactarius indigo]|nr:hypothetical protein H4582DRAFT_2061855 [Lactarius indigo]